MTSPFASSRAKLARGVEHFDALKPELDRVFDPDAYNITLYKGEVREPDTPIFVTYFAVGSFPQPPHDIGIAVGDVIHNYRSALDHMTWKLVRLRGKMPTKPSRRRQIQFPFANSGSDFDGRRRDRLPGVPDPFIKIIKRYQPYRGSYESQAFRLMRRLSDTDKHRIIVPAVTGAAETDMEFWGENCKILDVDLVISPKRALYEGYPVAFVTALDDDGFIGRGKVHSEGIMVAHPSFGRGQDVIASLTFMAESIAKLLDEIEAAL